MLHVLIIKTTQFLFRKHLFFSFASAAYLQRKSLYLSLFDCQNLFTANKLIRLQRTRPGDRGINDAAKSTCSETTRHQYAAMSSRTRGNSYPGQVVPVFFAPKSYPVLAGINHLLPADCQVIQCVQQ